MITTRITFQNKFGNEKFPCVFHSINTEGKCCFFSLKAPLFQPVKSNFKTSKASLFSAKNSAASKSNTFVEKLVSAK